MAEAGAAASGDNYFCVLLHTAPALRDADADPVYPEELHPEDILLCRDGCLFRFYFLSWWELSTAQILRTDWMGLHPA